MRQSECHTAERGNRPRNPTVFRGEHRRPLHRHFAGRPKSAHRPSKLVGNSIGPGKRQAIAALSRRIRFLDDVYRFLARRSPGAHRQPKFNRPTLGRRDGQATWILRATQGRDYQRRFLAGRPVGVDRRQRQSRLVVDAAQMTRRQVDHTSKTPSSLCSLEDRKARAESSPIIHRGSSNDRKTGPVEAARLTARSGFLRASVHRPNAVSDT